jgi:IS1 family transposase
MNRLPLSERAQILGLLVEGNSLRAASRLVDVSFNTVLKFVADIGRACSDYQDKALRNLPCKRLQLDEIWAFCYAKAKNVPRAKSAPNGAGDVWTWTAIDADTKLAASWMVGDRSGETARIFVADLASRVAGRTQITTDGHKAYLNAIDEAFGINMDYAVLEKIYAVPSEAEKRYSPPVCIGATRKEIMGRPDQDHISTSYVERQNLTMRMSMRRFTRLTNAFSQKVENHAHAVALHFMWYNFGRIHKTLRVTPAMAAGVTDHIWTLEEVAELDVQAAPAKRGPYKKRAA